MVTTAEKDDLGRSNYTHTVLGEEASATWCGYCPAVVGYMSSVFYSGNYDFYYVTLVQDRNPYAAQRINELNIGAFPTVAFDGGYRRVIGDVGGTGPYISALNACGARSVADIDIAVDVTWNGNAQLGITASVTNNQQNTYTGHIHAYVTEIDSRWYVFGHQYDYAMIGNYALNQNINVPAESTMEYETTWNGQSYGFGDIEQDNIMIIISVLRSATGFTDDTAAATPYINQAPETPDQISGPNQGVAGQTLTFETQSTDPNDNDLLYQWRWGDGSTTTWLGPFFSGEQVSQSHRWIQPGKYAVQVRVKDSHGLESDWSTPAYVKINVNPLFHIKPTFLNYDVTP